MNKSFATPTFSLLTATLALAGCVVQAPPAPRVVYAAPAPAVSYVPQPPPPVVSVYIEPPLVQPPPVVIGWAPPPMLVEAPPIMPFEGAVWIGGYWAWHGNWVWSAGRWAPPPQPGYGWVHPYYENRSGVVVFVGGHWAAPGVAFVPPPPSLNLTVAVALAGVVPGPRPIGPPGVFVPPPPGSRPGLIVPAPIGTPPAVVIGAPPVTNVGMRIQSRVENNTTVNNTRVTNITNVTNVTVVAPASATLSGHAFEAQVPNQAHLAAAQTPVVHAFAPTPASNRPMAAFAVDRAPAPLPAPQPVQTRPAMAAPAVAAAPAPSPAPVQRTEALPAQSARPEHPVPAPPSRATDSTPVAPASAAAPTPHTPQVQANDAARQAAKRQQAEARRAEAAKAKAAKEKPRKEEEHEHEHEHEHKQE